MKRFLQIISYLLVAAAASCATLFALGRGSALYPKLTELGVLIDRYFVDEVDYDAVEDAAAEAMVDALGDQWSYYMTAQAYQDYKERMNNAYVGIGVTITQREDGYITIMKVEPGGPAEEAGVAPGDVLTAVAGQDISSMDMEQIRGMVKGKEGTTVKLCLRRDEKSFETEVERRTIQSIVAQSRMLDGNIGLVTIVNFDSRCAEETLAAVEQMLEQGAQSLIFDVRFNPGGYKKELVKILDYLLPAGDLFRSEDYAGRTETDTSNANHLKMPMAVLLNGNSYSAAEFFAAALDEYDWATVVGEASTGKSHFQVTIPLRDGSAVNLSIGKYYTPKGVSLADVGGLQPEVLVEVDDETEMAIYAGTLSPQEDPQIQRAVEVLKTGN